MDLSQEQVKQVVELAKLETSSAENKNFSEELSSILNHVEKVGKAKTDQPFSLNRLEKSFFLVREDQVLQSSDQLLEELKNLFPEREEAFCKVPKIN